jgi:hypothetical protein
MDDLLQAVLALPDHEKARICTELMRVLWLLPGNFHGRIFIRFNDGNIVHADGEMSFDTESFLRSAKKKTGKT